MPIAVYLEVGQKRTFAGAVDWPGWCRGGPHEQEAIATFVAYGPRYVAAIRGAGDLELPRDGDDLEIVERIRGDATTDFGAPGTAPAFDDGPIDEPELERQIRLLGACWGAFDRAVAEATGLELRKGPRGGGRDLGKIAGHILDAERAYLGRLGSRALPSTGQPEALIAEHREQVTETLRARGLDLPIPNPTKSKPRWSPRYFVRRSAWHLLDHAWEIEDRAEKPASRP